MMEFVLLAIALALAAGVAGVRLSFGAHRRIGAVQRLHDAQMAGARRRITELETALGEAGARLLRAQAVEAAARRTQAALLTGVSRELRLPLEVVLGFADVLRLNAASEPLSHRQGEAVDQIAAAARRLLTVVEGLMSFAGAVGPASPARVRLDPVLIARRLCQDMAPCAEAAGVALEAPSVRAGLTVLGDAPAVEQILGALIQNGVQHNRRGGRVRVEADRSDETVRITVRDTGPGVPSARLADLFEPFARRDRPASERDGAGVGLANARRLARAMGGDLTLDEPTGQGAAFTLRLPAASAPLTTGATGAAEATRPASAPGSGGVVLYIADDAPATALMRQLLPGQLLPGLGPIQLHVAPGAEGAAGLARDLQPHAILLDLDLAGGEGLAVKIALEADPLTRRLPVVALSAAVDPDEVQRARAAGFADYLTKPVQASVLAERLSRLLAPPPTADRSSARPGWG